MPKGIYERTDSQNKKISETLKRKFKTGELKMSWTGKERTVEHIKNLSQSLKGRETWNINSKVKEGVYKIVTKKGIRKMESHWAWFDYYGHFPENGMVIHHQDFNVNNNKVSNLLCLTRAQHVKLHNDLHLTSKGEKRGSIVYKEFHETV